VDVGDVRERTIGVVGCSIVPVNVEDLAAGLETACRTRGQVNGRERMMELSLSRIAESISRFYEEIIAARKGQTLIRQKS